MAAVSRRTDFNFADNWPNDVDPGTDFGGNGIIFLLDDPTLDPTIFVNADILNIGDLDNTANGAEIIFDGSEAEASSSPARGDRPRGRVGHLDLDVRPWT